MTQPPVRIPFIADDDLSPVLARQAHAAEVLASKMGAVGDKATVTGRKMALAEQAADDLADELDRAARKADDLADELDGVSRAGGQLAVQITATKARIKELAAEIDRTTDKTVAEKLFGDLDTERSKLAKLQQVFRHLGDEGGKELSRGLLDTLGALPAQLRGSLLVAGVGVGAALAPALGAAVSAAVIGGVGVGGLAGGIALAARDPQVQQAAKKFALEVGAAFEPIGQQFAGPVIDALDVLGDTAARFANELDLGPVVDAIPTLAAGIDDFTENVMPGFNKGLATGGRLLEILGAELGDLGDAVGDGVGALAEEEGTVLGFIALLDLLEAGIRGSAEALRILGAAFHDTVSVGAKVTGAMEDIAALSALLGGPVSMLMSDAWANQNDHLEGMLDSLAKTDPALAGLLNGFRNLTDGADDLETEMEQMDRAFQRAFDRWMSIDEAKIAVEAALDAMTESFKENGRTLDINSAKGRENAERLLVGVQAIEQHRQAMIDDGESIAAANVWYDQQLARFRAAAIAAGANVAALDALLRRYQDLTKLPDITKTVRVKFLSDKSGYHPPPTAGRDLFFYDEGGEVGPGLPRGTPVPIVAHAGEVVLPEDLADQLFGLQAAARPAAAALPTGGGVAAGGPMEVRVVVDLLVNGETAIRGIQKHAVASGIRSLEALFGLPAAA